MNIEGIRNYPLTIRDETIAKVYGVSVESVTRARADLRRAEDRRERARQKQQAGIDAIPMGHDRNREMMINGSRKLLERIQATEFYRSH